MSTSSSTRRNLGPLTATFTPPPTCSVLGVVYSTPTQAWQAQQCFTSTTLWGTAFGAVYTGGVADDLTCWPSTSLGVPSPTPAFGGLGFYSPGLVCPVGHTSTCGAALHDDGSPVSGKSGIGWPFQFSIEPGETAVGCCPVGYFCATFNYNGVYQTCMSFATTGTLKVTQCASSPVYTKTITYNITVPITQTSPPISSVSLFAPMIQLVYKSTDVKMSVTATVTVQGASASHTGSSGLSTGDQAAVGVGVVAAVILVLAVVLGWLFLRQRRKARLAEKQRVVESDKAANPDVAVKVRAEPQAATEEASGTALSELPAPTAELPTRRPSADHSKNSTGRWA